VAFSSISSGKYKTAKIRYFIIAVLLVVAIRYAHVEIPRFTKGAGNRVVAHAVLFLVGCARTARPITARSSGVAAAMITRLGARITEPMSSAATTCAFWTQTVQRRRVGTRIDDSGS
jgi:hypothetical protein